MALAAQHRREPARAATVAAGDQLPGRRSGGEVQQLLAAPRLHLRPDRATARRSRARTSRATTARSAPAASPGTINPVAATTLRYPWTDLERRQVRAGQRNHDRARIRWRSVTGNWSAANPANTDVGELGRSEPEERRHRRVHRRRRSGNRRGIRGGRQLHLAQVRRLHSGTTASASRRPTGWRRRSRRPAARPPTATASAPATARRSRTISRRSSSRR